MEIAYVVQGLVLLLLAALFIPVAVTRVDDDMGTIYECSWCEQEIDPDLCHCGELIDKHGYGAGHSPIPMGCDCGRSKV